MYTNGTERVYKGSGFPMSTESDFVLADYVRVVVLDKERRKVLLAQTNDCWDLPYFVYPQSLNCRTQTCCKDFQCKFLGITERDHIFFNAVFEFFGALASTEEENSNPPGYAQLMLLESHFSYSELQSRIPVHAKWADADFVITLLEQLVPDTDKYISLETTLSVLQHKHTLLLKLEEPRHQFGWFQNASRWLCSVVEPSGDCDPGKVAQELMSPTSTILKVNCKNGPSYLKSPVLGTKEAETTRAISSLFPNDTVQVLAISAALHSFVTKGFKNDRATEKDAFGISMQMGLLQKSSLEHLEKLRSAGVEIRGPFEISEALDSWVDDSVVKRAFGGRFQEFVSLFPRVRQICAELQMYKIPLSLIHGDLMPHNAVLKHNERGFLMYDWEYCCISHPFCDFHELHELLKLEEIREYLNLWSEFEQVERLEEAFHKARILGWWLKIWTMLNCIREGDLQRNSVLASFARDCFDYVDHELS